MNKFSATVDNFINFLSKKIGDISMTMLEVGMINIEKGNEASNILNYTNSSLISILSNQMLSEDTYHSLKCAKIEYEYLYEFCINAISENGNDSVYHNIRGLFERFESWNFSLKDQLEILRFIMMSNVSNIEFCDGKYYKFYKLSNLNLKYYIVDDIFDLVDRIEANENYLENYLNKLEDEDKKEELKLIISTIQSDLYDNLKYQKKFLDAYNSGKNKEENINIMVNSLKNLEVRDEHINKIKEYLNQKVVKKEEAKDFSFENANESYIDKEKYKQELREELKKYLDSRTLLPIKFLTYNELKETIKILKVLDIYSEELVTNITKENELMLSKVSFSDKYNYYIELMEYYVEKYGFVEELKELRGYYNELLVSTDEEDNKFFTKTGNDIMHNILKYVPNMKEYLKETI